MVVMDMKVRGAEMIELAFNIKSPHVLMVLSLSGLGADTAGGQRPRRVPAARDKQDRMKEVVA